MKNLGRKVLLLGLATMIFVSVLFSLKTNSYLLEESLKGLYVPVSESTLTQNIDLPTKDVILKDSSFVRLYKNTEIRIGAKQYPHLQKGNLFLVGTPQSQQQVYLNQNTKILLQDFAVFLESNIESVKIYTFEKPVPILIENEILLLPKQSNVTISKQSSLSPQDITHQELETIFSLTPNNPLPKVAKEALKGYETFQTTARKIVFSTPKIWEKYTKSNFSRHIKNRLSLSVPRELRAQWFFAKKTRLLSHGIELLQKNKIKEAQHLLSFFQKQLKSQESLHFFQTFPAFREKWETYQNAVAVFSNFQNDSKTTALKTLLEKGTHVFSVLEDSLSKKDFGQSVSIIKNMKHLEKNKAKRVRLFWDILQNPFIQNETSIQLYTTFDFRSLQKDHEKEAAIREILSFLKLKNFEPNSEENIIKMLFPILENLHANNFLNEEEKEFLKFTKKTQKIGLSREEIKQIKEEEAVSQKFKQQQEAAEQEKQIIEKAKQINNTKQLIEFLKKLNIEIKLDTLKSNRAQKTTQFTANYKKNIVTGIFHYNSQYFSKITFNNDQNKTYKNIPRNEIKNIVNIVEQESAQQDHKNPEKNLYDFYKQKSDIPQTNTNSIRAKQKMIEYLRTLGFYHINILNTTVLNQALTKVQFTNVSFNSIKNLQFVFNNGDQTFENIVFTKKQKIGVKKGVHTQAEIIRFLKDFSRED
ncbi:hypothetical protein CSB37_01435 [bacterium DOLZORAL124_38_8]|nr:MAG: hypothetical protein CSB37_01435 [bacterium DOLZORAL124_38_8]